MMSAGSIVALVEVGFIVILVDFLALFALLHHPVTEAVMRIRRASSRTGLWRWRRRRQRLRRWRHPTAPAEILSRPRVLGHRIQRSAGRGSLSVSGCIVVFRQPYGCFEAMIMVSIVRVAVGSAFFTRSGRAGSVFPNGRFVRVIRRLLLLLLLVVVVIGWFELPPRRML